MVTIRGWGKQKCSPTNIKMRTDIGIVRLIKRRAKIKSSSVSLKKKTTAYQVMKLNFDVPSIFYAPE